MNRIQETLNQALVTVFTLLVFVICLLLTGCQETQKQYKQGELPPDYKAMFGTDNGARLNFTQQQQIDRLRAAVFGVNKKNPDGSITHTVGALGRVTVLEADVLSLKEKPASASDVSLTETSEVKPLTHELIKETAAEVVE